MLGCLTLCPVADSESQCSDKWASCTGSRLARASSKVALAGSESSSSGWSSLLQTSGVAQGGKLKLHIISGHSWVLTFARPQDEVYNTSRAGRTGQTYLRGLAELGRPTCLFFYVCGWPDLYSRPASLQHLSETVCGLKSRVYKGTVSCSHSLRCSNKGCYREGSHYQWPYYSRARTL